MKTASWDSLSAWYNEWLAADAQERERLRARLAAERPDVLAEADALAAASGHLSGFLETPALLLAAHELAQDDPLLAADTLIGPYQLVTLLARGGTGDVYRATDVRLRRDVAVKVLAQSRTSDPQRVERFMQEARVTAALDHPNIVRVYDVGRFDDRAYLVAELLEGETVRARIARTPMPIHEVVQIGLEVAHGLEAAHAAGLVHRDLKPDNLFVTRSGTTKILDFGIAKLAQADASRDGLATVTGVVLGTAGYLAPEQIRGEAIDARADLFALGSVLFEMLTGTRAFGREHMVDTLHAILHDPPSAALAERDDVPPPLADLVLKLLEKSPDARFQSAAEVIEALKRVVVDETAARQRWPWRVFAPPRRSRARPRQRHGGGRRARWMAIGVLAAVLAAVVAWMVAGSSGSATEVRLAVMPFEITPSADGNELLGLGLAALLADRLGQQLVNGSVLAAVDTRDWKTKDAAEAARRLSLTHVLSGRMTQDGGRTRVTAELFSTDGGVIALEPMEVPAEGVGSVQDAIASHVIPRLATALAIRTRGTGPTRGPRDERASAAYLRGRALVLRPNADDLKQAAGSFEEALRLDPQNPEAWAGLGSAYKRMPITGGMRSTEAFTRAEQAARRALAIDADNAEAYSVLGTKAFWYDWDYPAAEQYLKQALRLNENHADSHLILGHLYANIGRAEEALREIRRTRDLDSQWAQPRAMEGLFLILARKYDEALSHLDTVANVTDPALWTAHAFRADALLALGRAEEASRVFERSMELPSSPLQRSQRGYFLARAARSADAEAALAEVPPEHAYSRALILHALGRNEQAMVELNRAVDDKAVHVIFTGIDYKWDALRGWQPFRDVARRVNLLEVSERTAALTRSER